MGKQICAPTTAIKLAQHARGQSQRMRRANRKEAMCFLCFPILRLEWLAPAPVRVNQQMLIQTFERERGVMGPLPLMYRRPLTVYMHRLTYS